MKYALIGAAGYIAPRHMQAIKDTGGDLVAVLDPHDSVGILDSYFPECQYFRETERFDRWLSKNPVDCVSVCSPNYLHDSHCLMAMRNGADVICEKPLTCHERNLDNLAEWEVRTGKKVNVVLQCRLHPEVIKFKEGFVPDATSVLIDYRTPRGVWYSESWKGDIQKSGGIATNIGVHLFDLSLWLFGPLQKISNFGMSKYESFGEMVCDGAVAEWYLSIKQCRPRRIFKITDHKETMINFTNGFTNLHTKTYEHILEGIGFGIEDIRPATRLVEAIRDGC